MGQEGNSYYPCLKCNVLVPYYAKEIHSTECHTLNLRNFSHPLISGISILGQALIMADLSTLSRKSSPKDNSISSTKSKDKKNTSKASKGNEKADKKEKSPVVKRALDSNSKGFLEEPEWLKKILPGFHHRIALMNELDLIRCTITAYTPVLLEYDNSKCAFIAVPDDCVRIGHVVLHHAGCLQYLPSLSLNSLIWIKKIAKVELADQVFLEAKKDMSEEESVAMEGHLKNIMLSSYPLGAPFTVTVGSLLYPHSLTVHDSQSFKVVSCVSHISNTSEADQLLETMASLNLGDKNLEDSPFKSKDKSLSSDEASDINDGESDTSAYITIDEYKEGDSLDEINSSNKSFTTSTPQKMGSKTDMCRSLLMSRTSGTSTSLHLSKGKELSSIDDKIQGINSWFRVGLDTGIVIKQSQKECASENAKKPEKKEVYCKDNVYHTLMKIMLNKLKNAGELDNPFLSGWSGVLLYGPPGTGKTLLVNEIASTLDISLVTLTLSDITVASGSKGDSVRHKFRLASERAPSVLFIDELDALCPAGEHRISRDQDLTRAVINGILSLKNSDNPVLLIAATSRIEGVSMKLRCSGRFDKELLVSLPNAQQRAKILQYLLKDHCHNVSAPDIGEIAKSAYGYSGADLDLLLKCAWFNNIQKRKSCTKPSGKPCLCKENLLAGMAGVVPTLLRQDFQAVCRVKWTDIFGYESLKLRLQKMIHQHISDPENQPLKGVLLYGPPGCSKTMFVKAIVNETGFSFFPIKCSDLLSKYVGETEKSLSRIFSHAQQTAPSIIFMDEVDSLCSDRAAGSGLVSELLSAMSETALLGNVLVIGATNRPQVLDEALFKPGCLEQVIHVDLPDFDCRCSIWEGFLKDIPLDGEVSIEILSQATDGYSGAEIAGVYQNAAQAVITQLASSKQFIIGDDNIVMTLDNLLSAIKNQPPRTPSLLIARIKEFSKARCLR